MTNKFKNLIGQRAIIISSLEEIHKNEAGRIWFELQKVGIQSTFLNLKSRFPSTESVQDGIGLVKRTGSTSIISVGNGTIVDYGKILQYSVENLSGGSFNALLENPTKFKAPTTPPRLNHIAVPTTLSPHNFTSLCQVIHPQEDILIDIPTLSPTLVCHDLQTLSLSHSYIDSEIVKGYLLVTLLDQLSSIDLTVRSLDNPKNKENVQHQLQALLAQLKESFTVGMNSEPTNLQ